MPPTDQGDRGVSEAASKKKPGRPRVWNETYLSTLVSFMGMEDKSRRHQHNFAYAQEAASALLDGIKSFTSDGPYAWLVCDKPTVFKVTVLAELGRLGDPEQIRGYARVVCEERLPARRAVALIRKARTGKAPKNRLGRLYHLLARAVLNHLEASPETTLAEVCVILDRLSAAYKDASAGGE